MSKLCPSCYGYQFTISGINKTKCTTCDGIGYVFDKPTSTVIDEIEQKSIEQNNQEIKLAKKKGRPKKDK